MFKEITCEQAEEKLKHKTVVLIDVRDEMAYKSGHIPGATHVARNNIDVFVQETNKQNPVLVYCYHGNSSRVVAEFLSGQGFSEIYSLTGGFTAWQSKYPECVSQI